jgi:uncharacterized protein (TIGR03083 family)
MGSPLWPMLAAERSALLDYAPTLTDAEWKRESNCAGWSVRDLLAHIVAGAKTTPLTFGPSLAISGFSFDRLGERGIRQQGSATPAQLTAQLRTRVDAKTVPGKAYLTEVLVHGEDIRRSVGAEPGDHPVDHLVAVADYVKTTGGPVHGKRRAQGLTFEASDVDWTAGSGPIVRGPLVLIVIAICGRGFALDELSGAGKDSLASHM